jgi:hypothetical protein
MRLAAGGRSFRELLVMLKPRIKDFGSLTMCPSCGLITSKYKTFCLECGKSLKAV